MAIIEKDIAVFKLGSDLIADPETGINTDLVDFYSEQIALARREVSPLIVVSGAVNTGRAFLRRHDQDDADFDAQELASLGTSEVSIAIRNSLMENHGIRGGQVLANQEQMKRGSVLMRGLLHGIARGMVYNINENDQENIFELMIQEEEQQATRGKKPDVHNDRLSAELTIALIDEMKAEGVPSDLACHLVMFTEIGGFILKKQVQAEISLSDKENVYGQCNGTSKGGSGGMRDKAEACFDALDAGAKTVHIASPRQNWLDVIRDRGIKGKVTKVVQ